MKMKFLSLALGVSVALLMSSCGGKQDIAKKTGFQEIEIPCTEKGQSDAAFFRASNVGKSKDLATSKEKALLLCKQRLASLIGSTLKSVTERYASEMDAAGATEFNQNFENMTRDVVNQKLQDITVTCEKTGMTSDGMYETYMAIEVSKEAILNGINSGISRDKKLEVKYDQMKFKEKFDEEMNKLEKQN